MSVQPNGGPALPLAPVPLMRDYYAATACIRCADGRWLYTFHHSCTVPKLSVSAKAMLEARQP